VEDATVLNVNGHGLLTVVLVSSVNRHGVVSVLLTENYFQLVLIDTGLRQHHHCLSVMYVPDVCRHSVLSETLLS